MGQQPGNQGACWDIREEGQAFDLCECVRVCAVARVCRVHLCVLASVSAGWHGVGGRPSCRVREVAGLCCAWCLTGGQTVGGTDHTLRTIITQDGGHSLLLIQQ